MKRWKVDDRGPRKGVHRHPDVGTITWGWQGRAGRFGFRLLIHQHCGNLPDRWVIQPSVTFDRRHHKTTTDQEAE